MGKKISQRLVSKIASKKALKQNEEAIRSYDSYKETVDLIEKVDIALGRKPSFKTATSSTLNFEVDQYGVVSTIAQKI